MDHAARHALRQQEAPALLDKIHEQILAMSRTVLPKSAAGKACSYALRLWKRLTIFLEYPELELSSNVAENSMRPHCNGQKKMDPPRQQTGWTTRGSNLVGRRRLPTH
jgi:transposase